MANIQFMTDLSQIDEEGEDKIPNNDVDEEVHVNKNGE